MEGFDHTDFMNLCEYDKVSDNGINSVPRRDKKSNRLQINPYIHSFHNPFGRTQFGVAWLWEEVEAKSCTPDQLGNPEIFVFKCGKSVADDRLFHQPQNRDNKKDVSQKKTFRQFWSDRFKTNRTWTQPNWLAFYSFQNDETKIGRVSSLWYRRFFVENSKNEDNFRFAVTGPSRHPTPLFAIYIF